MKNRILSILALCAGLTLSACNNPATPTPAPTPTPTGSAPAATPAPVKLLSAVTPASVQLASSLATSTALQFAVQDAGERATLALQCETAAHAVRTLATGGVVTPDQLQATLTQFGGPTVPQGYLVLAGSLSSIYATYYPELTKSGDATKAVAYLNAIAAGVESASAPYLK